MAVKIIIAGGGTGGHIFPAIAIANAIMKAAPDTEILFVGARGKMEMEKVPQAGYRIKGIDIAGFNRSSLIKNIGLPFKLVRSFFQVRRIFRDFRPDAAVGVGGYSSFPVLRFAQSRGIASFIHESNSFAGKSNILLGKKATRIFTATDGMEKFFPADRIQVTGNPVRQVIAESRLHRDEAIRHFGLDPSRPCVLVTGGSLGAKGINEAIAGGLQQFRDKKVQLIWQTGKAFVGKAKSLCSGEPLFYSSDFIAQMEWAFAAADLVVSRSGAMALSELCLAGKPVVFVPFPFAAEDHQTVNAQHLLAKSAALLVKDSEAREKLVPVVLALLDNPEQMASLGANMAKLAIRNADRIIAAEILGRLANRSAK